MTGNEASQIVQGIKLVAGESAMACLIASVQLMQEMTLTEVSPSTELDIVSELYQEMSDRLGIGNISREARLKVGVPCPAEDN